MKFSRLLSREQAKELDRAAIEAFGIPGIVLMENAGRSICDYIFSSGIRGSAVICCGRGNNGGDGFVVARHLSNHGVPVRVFLFADEHTLRDDALTNYTIAKRLGIDTVCVTDERADLSVFEESLHSAGWVVDALFGTGMQGSVNPFYAKVIMLMNSLSQRILAVDIPSGMDCDTGETCGVSVAATVTLTVAALKQGFLNPDSKKLTGDVRVIDAGFPAILFD